MATALAARRDGAPATRVPAVSVVICAYTEDRWSQLVEAVESCRRQTRRPAEIVVVVDHHPRLLARVRAELPAVRAVAGDRERGLAGARNAGLAAARGDVLAFLDDDAVAAPDWLERLAAAYADPAVLGAGGAIEPRWLGGRPRGFPEEFGWVVGCSYRGLPAGGGAVRNLIGANMSVRRSVLAELGGFRPDMGRLGTLPLGCEETELCIRAAQRFPGRRFVYDPAALVVHAVPPERAGARYFLHRCFAEGISKAHVAAYAGSRDGLSSERSYALRALPAGVARGLLDAARGDAGGALRATAIVAGLAATTAGYLVARIRRVRG